MTLWQGLDTYPAKAGRAPRIVKSFVSHVLLTNAVMAVWFDEQLYRRSFEEGYKRYRLLDICSWLFRPSLTCFSLGRAILRAFQITSKIRWRSLQAVSGVQCHSDVLVTGYLASSPTSTLNPCPAEGRELCPEDQAVHAGHQYLPLSEAETHNIDLATPHGSTDPFQGDTRTDWAYPSPFLCRTLCSWLHKVAMPKQFQSMMQGVE